MGDAGGFVGDVLGGTADIATGGLYGLATTGEYGGGLKNALASPDTLLFQPGRLKEQEAKKALESDQASLQQQADIAMGKYGEASKEYATYTDPTKSAAEKLSAGESAAVEKSFAGQSAQSKQALASAGLSDSSIGVSMGQSLEQNKLITQENIVAQHRAQIFNEMTTYFNQASAALGGKINIDAQMAQMAASERQATMGAVTGLISTAATVAAIVYSGGAAAPALAAGGIGAAMSMGRMDTSLPQGGAGGQYGVSMYQPSPVLDTSMSGSPIYTGYNTGYGSL